MHHRVDRGQSLVWLFLSSAIVFSFCTGLALAQEEESKPVETISPTGNLPKGITLTSSTSRSKQFVVFGERLTLRTAFSVAAEDIKADLRGLLESRSGGSDDFEGKILIVVEDDPIPGRALIPQVFFREDGTAQFQLNVTLNDNFRKEEFSRELIRLLIAEMILRGKRLGAGDQVELPAWLTYGITESIRFRKSTRPSSKFAAVFKAQKELGLDEILDGNPAAMGTVGREIYAASSCALIETLLGHPDGNLRLRRMIASMQGNQRGVKNLIAEHFPGVMLSQTSLRKWWTLQMAKMAAAGAFEAMNARETESNLDRLLVFAFDEEIKETKKPFLSRIFGGKDEKIVRPDIISVPGGLADPIKKPQVIYTLQDFEKILEREDREEPLQAAAKNLAALRARAYPLFRPLIFSYEQMLQEMVEGAKKKDIARKIEALAMARVETLKQARGVESYMDWFEGTQVDSKSGAFGDYRRAVEELEKLDKIKRTDRISRYLDALESEYDQ